MGSPFMLRGNIQKRIVNTSFALIDSVHKNLLPLQILI